MKRLLFTSVAIKAFAYISIAFAYEVKTHELISSKALDVSVLTTDPSVLPDLGLKPLLEKQVFQNPFFPTGSGTLSELLQFGANQEDNLGFPGVGGSRFMHHFYDPENNSALTNFTSFDLGFVSERFGVPYQPIQKSPVWALENNGDFPNDKFTGQIFSYKDARGYFFKALTGQSTQERDKYFGLTFQTLGHVIHHIQDMAQPQHVKNEQHPLGARSLYEKYTDKEEIRPSLPYTGYAPVYSLNDDHTTFDSPAKFWATGNGQGKGLAEFTNFNFVTYGHNFIGTLAQPESNPVYLHPQPIGFGERAVIDLPLAPQAGLDQAALDGKMYFIKAPVADAYHPSEARINNLASAFSLYDDDLTRWDLHVECQSMRDPSGSCTQQAVFTVNRFTMSAAHQFLIPRAVGYSAGLINYFFRGIGKINMVEDPATPGHLIIRNDGEEKLAGNFTLYYDDVNGNRFAVVPDPTNSIAAASWRTPDGGLVPGQSIPVPVFSPPGTDLRPAPKTPGEYMLVFKGTIGEEYDIAVAAKKVQGSGSTNFLTPAGRLQYTTSGWQFTPDTTLQYGNMDWQGPTPEDVVTWIGPRGRLVNLLVATQLSNKIFQGGRVLAEAPGLVIGAALSTESKLGLGNSEQKMIVAVVGVPEDSSDPFSRVAHDVVYAKPIVDSAGQGWQLLGSYGYEEFGGIGTRPSSYPAHWFFNADGNGAVSNKWSAGSSRRPHRPIQLTISGGNVAFVDISEVDIPYIPDSTATFTLPDAYVDYRGNDLVKLGIKISHFFRPELCNYLITLHGELLLPHLGRTYTFVDFESFGDDPCSNNGYNDWKLQWNIAHIDIRTGLIAYRNLREKIGADNILHMSVHYIAPDGNDVLVGEPILSEGYYGSVPLHKSSSPMLGEEFLLIPQTGDGEILPEESFDPVHGVGSAAAQLSVGPNAPSSGPAIISQSIIDFTTPVLQKTSLYPPASIPPAGLGEFVISVGIE